MRGKPRLHTVVMYMYSSVRGRPLGRFGAARTHAKARAFVRKARPSRASHGRQVDGDRSPAEAGLRARGRRTGRVLPTVRRFPGNAQCFMAKVVSTYRCGAAPALTRGSYRLPFQTYRSIKIERYVPWRA